MHITLLTALLALVTSAPQATRPQPSDPWGPYRFLVGTWTGEGQGQPGTTSGTATFRLDLDDRILVRTTRVAVPASGERPASTHRDLMVVFRPAPEGPVRAIYWDNEDHTIEYTASVSADGKVVTFLTAANAGAPRFRLTYSRLDASRVDVKFEMAPPGSDAFRVYTEGVTRKVEADR